MAFLLGEFLRSKPSIPKAEPIDIGEQTEASFAAMEKYLPQAAKLSAGLNNLTQSQWQSMMGMQIPGFGKTMENVGSYMQSMTAGQVPQEIQDMLQRNSAVKSLGWGGMQGGGSLGPSMGANDFARNLGLTGLELMGEGSNAALRWTQAATQSFGSQFVSPGSILQQNVPSTMERTQVNMAERDTQFQRNYLKNIVASQYSAGSRFAASEDAFMKML